MIITIDGPTASGKSTICRMLATQLRFFCLNSGMLYRALGYILLHHFGYTIETIEKATSEDIKQAVDENRFSYVYGGKIIFDGKDITDELKLPAIDLVASLIGQNVAVRKLLTELQRALTKKCDVAAEGRDTGSVVFPQADYKFYLTAKPEIRAKRYMDYQLTKGIRLTMAEALKIIQDRDKRDSERPNSPLIIPEKAIIIDNSLLNQDQTVVLMRSYIK